MRVKFSDIQRDIRRLSITSIWRESIGRASLRFRSNCASFFSMQFVLAFLLFHAVVAEGETTASVQMKLERASQSQAFPARPKPALSRTPETQPNLWLCGQAANLAFPRSAKLFAGWELNDGRIHQPTSSAVFVSLGNSIEDYAGLFSEKADLGSVQEIIFTDAEERPLTSPIGDEILFLPSAKFVAASVARSVELLGGKADGLVFRVPYVVATTPTLTRLSKFALVESPISAESGATQMRQGVEVAYSSCLLAIDRIVQGMRDLQQRRNHRSAQIWLAMPSLPTLLSHQSMSPFFGLADVATPDGVFVYVHQPNSDFLVSLPPALRPDPFEWVLMQSLFAQALTDLLNVPLVLAPGETTPSYALTIQAAVAAQIADTRPCKLALGAGTISHFRSAEEDEEGSASISKDQPVGIWSVVGNLVSRPAETRIRWNAGSRNVAIAIGDGILLCLDESPLAELLSLWLPCLRAGLPARFVAFASLSEPRTARSVRTVLTSFSFQKPRPDELLALAQWVKRGGSLVLFADGPTRTSVWQSPTATDSLADVNTTSSAESLFLKFLGLPPEISEGTYRVDEGWLYYSSSSLKDIRARNDSSAVLQTLEKLSRANRRSILTKPVWLVQRDDVIAGAIIRRDRSVLWRASGSYVDLTTTSLAILKNPSFSSGDLVLMRELHKTENDRATFLAANVPLLSEDGAGDLWMFEPSSTSDAGILSAQALFRIPHKSFVVEDAETGEGLDFEFSRTDQILRVFLCPETTKLLILPAP